MVPRYSDFLELHTSLQASIACRASDTYADACIDGLKVDLNPQPITLGAGLVVGCRRHSIPSERAVPKGGDAGQGAGLTLLLCVMLR